MICKTLLKNVSTRVDASKDYHTKRSEQEALCPSERLTVSSLYIASSKKQSFFFF